MENNDSGFFSRWSTRKLRKVEQRTEKPDEHVVETTVETPIEQSDAISQEKVATEQPSWRNPELDKTKRRQALRDIFQKPGIGLPDGLDEYERDYNYHNFAKLGDVVTHEMRRMLEKQAEQLAAAADAEADTKPAAKSEATKSEDNKLA